MAKIKADYGWHILALFLILSVIGLVNLNNNESVCPAGPTHEICLTAISIWANGTISRPEYVELAQHLKTESLQNQAIYWQDVFAFGKNGQYLPKHPLILSLVAVPFYGLFGWFGFWLLNQIFIVIIIGGSYLLIRVSFNKNVADLVTLFLLFGSQLLLMSYNLSYDLLGTALVVVAVVIFKRAPMVSLAVASTAIYVRPTFLIPCSFLLFYAALEERSKLKSALIGFLIVFSSWLVFNYYFWGGPFVTPYHRVPYFKAGEMLLLPELHSISFSVFVSDWYEKLFGSEAGLIFYNPATLLIIPALFFLKRNTYRRENIYALVSAIVLTAVIFSYSHWRSSFGGNRFLLPAIITYIVCSAALFKKASR